MEEGFCQAIMPKKASLWKITLLTLTLLLASGEVGCHLYGCCLKCGYGVAHKDQHPRGWRVVSEVPVIPSSVIPRAMAFDILGIENEQQQ